MSKSTAFSVRRWVLTKDVEFATDEVLANHMHMIAIYTVFYNWTKIHKTLRVTPAMAAGLTQKPWEMAEIVALMDEGQ